MDPKDCSKAMVALYQILVFAMMKKKQEYKIDSSYSDDKCCAVVVADKEIIGCNTFAE